MKKLLYITNIPAPYRQVRFNAMAKIFPEYGIEFEVLYMADIEPDRQWVIPDESYKYNYRIFKGIHPNIGGFFAHFNPGLLFRLLKNDYDLVVIGGMASPTHWLAPFFISPKKFSIMSVESNLLSVRRTKGLGAKVKSILLDKANAFQVTGKPQIDYILYFQANAKDRKFIRLPNLIDEEVFSVQVDKLKETKETLRHEFGVSDSEQMWVLPSRLIKIKGIVPFLKALVGLNGYRLFILGDGEQHHEIQNLVNLNKLNVDLIGFLQQNELIRYYAAADLFVLPSFKDSSPLSPIEAIAAGLPILVSQNIGNIEDVLEDGVNGWKFEPGNVPMINKLAKDVLKLNRNELEIRGIASRKQYLHFFETENCLRNYAQQIQDAIKND